MPAQKKPADQLQRRNKPTVFDPQLVAINTAEVPEPPANVSEDLVTEWQALWTSELAATYTKSDLPAMRRLFELRHRVAVFEEIALSLEAAYDSEGNPIDIGPVTKGSTGQLSIHPLLKQADSYRSQILALEDRFGLSPQARLKLGIALGQAQQSLDAVNNKLAERLRAEASNDDPRLAAIDITETG